MSTTTLNMLTLNCWGLKLPKPFCQLRKERLHAIGDFLAKGHYDLVLLQEVWVTSDYEELSRKLFAVLPYSHYFHSGLFGSGLCVFSRHSILETLQHRFALNGSPFRVLHGDWYAQKCAGLVQVAVNGLRINVYIAHTLADYASAPAAYRVHRLVQILELAQFVRLTSDGCDAVLLGGDLNTTPADIGYNMVLAAANLTDCWSSQSSDKQDDIGVTVNEPGNVFSKPGLAAAKRIDFLFYRNNSGCDIRCTTCDVTMRRVPGADYNYSDHYAVSTSLILRKNVTAMAPEVKQSCVRELYKAAVPLLEGGVSACHNDRLHYALTGLLCLIALGFLANVWSGCGLGGLVPACRVLLMLLFGLCLWCGIVVSNREENAVLSAKKDLENQLRVMG